MKNRHTATPYDELADAIIAQAAEDYRQLLIIQKQVPDVRLIKAGFTELENFFNSEWFMVLAPSYRITGELIMELVRKDSLLTQSAFRPASPRRTEWPKPEEYFERKNYDYY